MTVDMRSLVGSVLRDTYVLDAFVAEGGFGAVFQSQQRFLGVPVRRVAVKVSKAGRFDVAKAREIFADVFLLAQAMDEMDDSVARSRLVHVYDAGLLPDLDNRVYVVMEYVKSGTLEQELQSHGCVPWNMMLDWTKQICQGLAGLHGLSPAVLHRDLKPNNVLLGGNRGVRLVDFGLAARLVHHGIVPGVAGALDYMAPETMQGAGESVPASDVYSVGLILYRGLTGRHPYGGLEPPPGHPETLHRDWLVGQLRGLRIPSPTTLNSTVPRWLDSIVMRCLKFSWPERYRNAGDLLKALETEGNGDGHDPCADTLEKARRLQVGGDPQAARAMIERALGSVACPPESRFRMLFDLGAMLHDEGQFAEAAGRLVEAWQMDRGTVILRTTSERADLLQRIVDAYRAAGNGFQAGQYQRQLNQELNRTPR